MRMKEQLKRNLLNEYIARDKAYVELASKDKRLYEREQIQLESQKRIEKYKKMLDRYTESMEQDSNEGYGAMKYAA